MTETDVKNAKWFQELQAEVQEAYDLLFAERDSQVPALENEKSCLNRNVAGWTQTLANPELSIGVREHIVSQFNAALERIADIDIALNVKNAEAKRRRSLVDPAAIVVRLNNLSEVLAGKNPSWGSVELSHHIANIDCFDDGRVVVKTCKLGVIDDAIEVFGDSKPTALHNRISLENHRRDRTVARRLTRRRIDTGEAPDAHLTARAIWATDPNRFVGLDDRWFVEHVFHLPERLTWAEEHATEVGARRKSGETEENLAKYFGKSIPTIRDALEIARESDPELLLLPRRMARSRWHEEYGLEVFQKKSGGMGTNELVALYQKSDTTIRTAYNFGKQLAAITNGAATPPQGS